ncbi:hypothetical protein NGF19_29580 [Streptomyces sp. RY43-2]|uniref:Lipoprotein n=1 Tax=Streptomyces macrolidinus TaxID=2952607 RepID=A0ABT0ZMR9_9ACTN|nr:hypothetical protein [Streptomyces macrolidinus]MCN9244884.1 hypothetical protein [Streptomyces macrolidinus]
MTAISQGRTRRRAAWAGALCALLVTGAGMTGCSSEEDPDAGTNGVGKLSPDKIQSRTRAAAKSVATVRLAGTVVGKDGTYTLDMRLSDSGGTGSVSSKNGTFHLLKVGEQLYLKADAAYWSQGDEADGKGSEAAADKLEGKYVKVPEGDPAYQRFSGFTDKDALLDGLLTLHGTLATAGRHEQDGVRTIRITGDKGAGGTLDVSLDGTPFPLRLVRAGNAGTLRLADWGKDVALKEPPKDETVDYGQQLPSS